MPVVISFTVETDGRLPTGQSLGEASQQIDAATSAYPSYFMINCAHPSHFSGIVQGDEAWANRIMDDSKQKEPHRWRAAAVQQISICIE